MENDLSLTYAPPHNLDVEERILASCLLFPEDEIFESIKPEYFYRTAHKKIFEACLHLHTNDAPVDITTVSSQLAESDELDFVGGRATLARLCDSPVITNTKYFCAKLRAYAELRRLIEISNAIVKRCFASNTDDLDSIVDYANTELLKINSTLSKTQFRPIKEVAIDCLDHCETIAQQGGVTGVPSGFTDLDVFTCGFQPGDLILLAGRPSMGKTALMDCCVSNAAEKNHRSLILSLEMTDLQLGNRFLASESRIDSLKFRSGRFSNDDWQRLHDAATKIARYDVWLDDSPRSTYQEIQRKARYAKRQFDIHILWIDYLGFVDGDKDEHRKDLEIQTISRGLKVIAKELRIPVVLVCQLSRKCEERSDKRPILSDLRDSGSLEQDADVVLFIYRDEVYNKKENNPNKGIAEIIIAKQRNGPTGTIKLCWLESYTRFENLKKWSE